MSIEQRNRNVDILRKQRLGRSYVSIAKEYGLSESRIRQICDHVRREERRIPMDIYEIEFACHELDASQGMNKRIQNALAKYGLDKNNRWRRLDHSQLMEIPGLGAKAVEIIEMAQFL